MSSDRRPAKVRIVTGSNDAAPDAQTPARRRGDRPEDADGAVLALSSGAAQGKVRASGASPALAAGTIALFLIGCLIGGALIVLSGVLSSADL